MRPDFEPGDILECIDSAGTSAVALTEGKAYIFIGWSSLHPAYLIVRGDDGEERRYMPWRFRLLARAVKVNTTPIEDEKWGPSMVAAWRRPGVLPQPTILVALPLDVVEYWGTSSSAVLGKGRPRPDINKACREALKQP